MDLIEGRESEGESERGAEVQVGQFWSRLQRLEERHRVARRAHDVARRQLEASRKGGEHDLRRSWEAYCEAIGALDDATAELEQFRGQAIRAFAE